MSAPSAATLDASLECSASGFFHKGGQISDATHDGVNHTKVSGRRPGRHGPYVTQLNVAPDSFPARVRILRVSLGMTQDDLGQATGLSKKTIISYERGITEPGAGALMAIAGALGATAERLWFGRMS